MKQQSWHYFPLFCKKIWGKENVFSLFYLQHIVHFLEKVATQVFDELINTPFGRNLCTFYY